MISRRQLLRWLGSSAVCFTAPTYLLANNLLANNLLVNNKPAKPVLRKVIPSTGESIHSVGMGTWQTFNVGSDIELRAQRTQLVKLFIELGGQMIDSSPMYGSSQAVVGHALAALNFPDTVFSAEKVWSGDGSNTRQHIEQIKAHWRVNSFDLMQVHNLLRWQDHLEALKEMKRNGELRYIGITTSHGRRHNDLEDIMLNEPIDFVQLTYHLDNRDVESRLLPIALEKGIAVIVNRPFQGGYLIDRLQNANTPLPPWAASIDCYNWPQFLLKFIISHPAVTCVIPATTKLEHLRENMSAATGKIPTTKERQAMLNYFTSI